ncbi:hypothetical protein ACVLD2_002660 [Paenibacillus sp. PvR052]
MDGLEQRDRELDTQTLEMMKAFCPHTAAHIIHNPLGMFLPWQLFFHEQKSYSNKKGGYLF